MTAGNGVQHHRGRLLLGSAGDGDDWSTLHGHLEDAGWQVVIFDAVPRLDGDSVETALPSVNGVDLAVVVIARSDRRVDLLTSRRLNHLVGVLQGQLGFGRVLVLTENEIESFLHGSGVTEVRYDRGNVQARLPQLRALLEDMVGGSRPPDRSPPFEEGRSLLERLGVTDGTLRPEMLVGGGVLLVMVVVLIVTAWQVAGGAAATDPVGEVGSGQLPSDDTIGAGTAQQAPGGPVVAGDVGSLPATCVVDISDGSMLPDVVECEGIGGLRVEGHRGPWFLDLDTVEVDPGVVGHVELAGGGEAADTVALTALEATSVPVGSGSGAAAVRLQFSSDGQQVTFHQPPGRGGDQAVLTFSLEL